MIKQRELWWWMYRLWLWLGLALSWLHAAENIEFYATVVESNATHIHASGNVLVLYQDYYLSASEATYERNTSNLELYGNIVAMQGSDYFSMGDYARLNTQKKERYFSPFFMLEKRSRVWLSSLEASSEDDDFQKKTSLHEMISSMLEITSSPGTSLSILTLSFSAVLFLLNCLNVCLARELIPEKSSSNLFIASIT